MSGPRRHLRLINDTTLQTRATKSAADDQLSSTTWAKLPRDVRRVINGVCRRILRINKRQGKGDV